MATERTLAHVEWRGIKASILASDEVMQDLLIEEDVAGEDNEWHPVQYRVPAYSLEALIEVLQHLLELYRKR